VNINMLRDIDDNPGYYVAVTSPDPKWPGCALFQSDDNGTTYSQIATMATAATMGRVLGVLGDFAGGHITDEINTINVALTRGSLSSVPYASLLNGAQTAIIGDEIVHFRDAVLNDDGTYTVSGFLRGMRGSEYAMGSHAAGERFILVNASTMQRIDGVTADLHVPKLYKAVTLGSTLARAAPRSFTNDGAGLKPYAPVHIGGGRDADGNLTINWTRRTRVSGEWRNNVDVPLGEASEVYEVEIVDETFTTVKRTFSGLTSPTVTYSADDQTADGYEEGDPVYVRVYQLSATVGRGYPGSAALGLVGELSGTDPVVPTLYVSTTGSDSNSGTSAASPFLTIQKAVTVATAGDIVSVASGTYAETIYGTNDGTLSQPIKFISETLWGAKIVPPTTSTRDTGFDHRGNYVTIEGFEVDGTTDPSSGPFWKIGINITGTNSLVTRCHVHHIYRNHDADSGGGAGILCDSYYGQNGGSATRNLVHHIGPISGVGGSFVQGIYFTTAQAKIENNVVSNVTGYGFHGWHDVRNTKVTNNTSFNNGEGGFVVGGGDYVNQTAPCDYMVVTNNIAYGNTGYGFSEQGDNGAHNIWSNNLANGNGTDWSLNTSSHVNDVAGSPGFVNYQADGSGDYHLDTGSPAIGAGLATYAPATDFSGVTRTSPFDLGAYKYTGT